MTGPDVEIVRDGRGYTWRMGERQGWKPTLADVFDRVTELQHDARPIVVSRPVVDVVALDVAAVAAAVPAVKSKFDRRFDRPDVYARRDARIRAEQSAAPVVLAGPGDTMRLGMFESECPHGPHDENGEPTRQPLTACTRRGRENCARIAEDEHKRMRQQAKQDRPLGYPARTTRFVPETLEQVVRRQLSYRPAGYPAKTIPAAIVAAYLARQQTPIDPALYDVAV